MMYVQYKWALWQIDDGGTTVIISAVGAKDATYQDFLAALPENDCRYGSKQLLPLLLFFVQFLLFCYANLLVLSFTTLFLMINCSLRLSIHW